MSDQNCVMDEISRQVDASCAMVQVTDRWDAHESLCQRVLEDLKNAPKGEVADRLQATVLVEIGLARMQVQDWESAVRRFEEALELLEAAEEDTYTYCSIKVKIVLALIASDVPTNASRHIADILFKARDSIGVVAVFIQEIMNSVKDDSVLTQVMIRSWQLVGEMKCNQKTRNVAG